MQGAPPPNICPGCGQRVTPTTKFCGSCGFPIQAASIPPGTSGHQPEVFNADEDQPTIHREIAYRDNKPTIVDAAPPNHPSHGPDRTILGTAASKGVETSPPSNAQTRPLARPVQQTILGMTSPVAKGQPPSSPSAPATPRVPAKNATMLGMQAPTFSAPGSLDVHTASNPVPNSNSPSASSQGSAPGSHAPAYAPTNRTMLGVLSPVTTPAATSPSNLAPGPPATNIHSPESSFHGQMHGPRDRANVNYAAKDSSIPPRKSKAPLFILGFFLLFALLGAGIAGAYLLWGGRGPAVHVEVARTADGESLRVEVPGAAASTKVRFRGEERVLDRGVAVFPLPESVLRVGENTLPIEVLEPGGTPATREVTLVVEFRVTQDLTGLSASPPWLGVAISAVAGSTAQVDGRPVPLDANGQTVARVSLPAAEPGASELTIRSTWMVTPPGGRAEQGVLVSRLPLTPLQLDRPGANAITEASSIEIAGAVPADARVTLDNVQIPVNLGRFLHRLELPAPGTFTPTLSAHSPGKAPNRLELSIRRVASLADEARNFQFDSSLTYARIQQNVDMYRGQRVSFEGRVYNVDVHEGTTILQVLVRDCPRGELCPLWVTQAAGADITRNTWVRVFGTLAGMQQFRSESSRIIEVPRVDASLVLPVNP